MLGIEGEGVDDSWRKKAADSFWLAAARNMEQRMLRPGQFQMLLIPGVVCMAFSIELGMKALLPKGTAAPRTHDLNTIFSMLDSSVRGQIIAACERGEAEFNALLKKVARAFEEWRYVYEQERPEIELGFLQKLADAVRLATDGHAP